MPIYLVSVMDEKSMPDTKMQRLVMFGSWPYLFQGLMKGVMLGHIILRCVTLVYVAFV